MPGELVRPSASCGIRPTTDLVAEYLFVDVLGRGKYGVVWKCRERRTGREFACKQIALKDLNPRALKVALREIDVLNRMRGAKHAVSLEAVYGDTSSLYLLLELCTGGDLLSRIEQKGRLPEREARQVFAAVVRAVGECHVRGIVHRDIKPENILLCPVAPSKANPRDIVSLSNHDLSDFVPKLADFGLALHLPADQQVLGYAGSFPYEAPEVVARAPYDISADVWSLGVLLFAMLSGAWPGFAEGSTDRRLERAVDWREECWAGVSARAKALIARLMAVDAEKRPSAVEILEDSWFIEEAYMADGEETPRCCPAVRTRGDVSGCHVALTIDVGCGEEDERGAGGEVWEERGDRKSEGSCLEVSLNRVAVLPPLRHVACRSPRGREQLVSPIGSRTRTMGGWGRFAAGVGMAGRQ
ncbi:hypothetical protein CLOM_g17884 [Closterium sp. NIES-68]|nr:hypothetical protein CLOM_g17884 [Closterium sp. NIES-68]GJP74004.1 hypothetical protein CLOP_g4657 [Closterium sp. NIES-67]